MAKKTSKSGTQPKFDHEQYRDEVEQRWGKDSYRESNDWWQRKAPGERAQWQAEHERLAADWRQAAAAGEAPTSRVAMELAARHEAWLAAIPGTPGYGEPRVPAAYLLGLAEMYVADPRFAANYGGVDGASFVKIALTEWVRTR